MQMGVDIVSGATPGCWLDQNQWHAVALDSKAALGFPTPAYLMAKHTTICAVAGGELDPSSWDRILCGGHGDSQPPVGPMNTTASIATESVAMLFNDGRYHR